MTITRPLPPKQFARDGKYFTTIDQGANQASATNSNPNPIINSFTINLYQTTLTLSIYFSDASKRDSFSAQFLAFLKSKKLFNKTSESCCDINFSDVKGMKYAVDTQDAQYTKKVDTLFSFIHKFDLLDKKTIQTIYNFFELPHSPLLKDLRSYAAFLTMGLFSPQENNNNAVLPFDVAGLIGEYLEDDVQSIALIRKEAAKKGKEKFTEMLANKRKDYQHDIDVIAESPLKKLKSSP